MPAPQDPHELVCAKCGRPPHHHKAVLCPPGGPIPQIWVSRIVWEAEFRVVK